MNAHNFKKKYVENENQSNINSSLVKQQTYQISKVIEARFIHSFVSFKFFSSLCRISQNLIE